MRQTGGRSLGATSTRSKPASEAISFAHIQVDESLSENQNPKAKNEPEEFITVFKKSVNEISEFFNQQSSQGIKFDAKLYSFFLAQGVL